MCVKKIEFWYIKFLFIVAICILTILSARVQAMSNIEFIARLKAYHPFFNQQQITSALAENEKRTQLAGEDWSFSINADYQSQNTEHLTSVRENYKEQKRTSVVSALSRNIYQTGGRVHFAYTSEHTENNLDSYQNRLSLDYTHPLWKNQSGINDKLGYDLASFDLQINTILRADREQNFLLEQLKIWLDLNFLQEQVVINEKRLALANKELNLAQEKFSVSLLEKVDVLLQKDAKERIIQQLLTAKQELAALKVTFSIMLGVTQNKVISNMNLYAFGPNQKVISKSYLMANNYALKGIALDREKNKRALLSIRNKRHPNLDLRLNLTSAGENNNFSDSLEKQSPDVTIGVNLSYPLGNLENNSQTQKNLLNLENINYEYERMLREIYAKARSTKKRIEILKNILESNVIQLEIAKKRSQEESLRYQNGYGDVSFVINAQDNEQNVMLSYAQNATNYQKMLLEYKAILNQIE